MTVPNKMLVATLALAAFGALGLAGTQIHEVRKSDAMNARIGELENEIRMVRDGNQSWSADISKQLDEIQNRMTNVAEDTHQTTDSVRKEQVQSIAMLRKNIDDHARAMAAERARSEEEIVETVGAQIGDLSGQVGKVNSDVDLVKSNLDATQSANLQEFGNVRSDLQANRQELGSVRDTLGRQIAQNMDELEMLKRRGERDLYEIELRKAKGKDMVRVAGIGLQLNDTDTKGKRYDVTLAVDDNKVQKKGQLINEPLQFQVGASRLRYELIVNTIDKDRVRGYISAAKPVIAADGRQPLGPVIRN